VFCFRQGGAAPWERCCVSKEAPDPGQKSADSSAPVVSGHVRVKLEPQAFDAVFVGTVGRQEVQPKSTTPFGERCLDDLAAVDCVVVEDQVKHPGATIVSQQDAQQVQEEPAPLLVALDPDQMSGAMAQGSGEEALYVLTGSENPALLPRQGPVRADPRIEIDIHFVDVECLLAPFQGREYRSDFSQTPLSARSSPRAQDSGPRPSPPSTQDSQTIAEGGSAHPDPCSPAHLPDEQFPTPTAALPATIGRNQHQQLLEDRQKVLVHLSASIVFSPILQPRDSLAKVLPGSPAHVSPRHLQVSFDGDRALSLDQQDNDEVAFAQLGVPCFLSSTRKGSTNLPGDCDNVGETQSQGHLLEERLASQPPFYERVPFVRSGVFS